MHRKYVGCSVEKDVCVEVVRCSVCVALPVAGGGFAEYGIAMGLRTMVDTVCILSRGRVESVFQQHSQRKTRCTAFPFYFLDFMNEALMTRFINIMI